MTRRRWIADRTSGNRAWLTGTHAQHLSRVLRARPGQEFDISSNNALRRGKIIRIDSDEVEFELGEEIRADASARRVTIAMSIFKFDRMEWAIEKCTELGAAQIVPMLADRTETHLAAAATKRVERWRRIVSQAAEQSRQVSPPEISDPTNVKAAVALPGDLKLVLSEIEETKTLKQALQSFSGDHLVLAFGPEGGWSDAELELFRNAGWISASLGGTILRAETAAIAALAVVLSELS